MSDLPLGWEWSTLGDVCEINPRFHKAEFPDEQLLTFIPMAAVGTETGHMDVQDVRTMGQLRKKSYRGFREGDILVAKITPSMENGKVAVAQGLHDGWGMGSTEFHVLRPCQGVEPWYVAWYVLQKGFRAEARLHMTGTAGQLRVPAGFLRSAPIPLPPTDQQRLIVEHIESTADRIDSLERSFQSALNELERLRRSVVAEAFSGRLVPQNADDEPASVLLERIAASRPANAKRRKGSRT